MAGAARTLDDMSAVRVIGIEDTSLRKGQNYITMMNDIDKKRLLFACEGRDLQAQDGKPEQVAHICRGMNTVYAKGFAQALTHAQISYDRFHVVAMANEAMDEVRRHEKSTQPKAIKAILSDNERNLLKSLTWGIRRNPDGWSVKQTNAMHWLQNYTLRCARAWRLKMELRTVYANTARHNKATQTKSELKAWLTWATR